MRELETDPSHEPVPALELGVLLGLEVCLVVVDLADARDEVHLGELDELRTEEELVADCQGTVRKVSVRVPSKQTVRGGPTERDDALDDGRG